MSYYCNPINVNYRYQFNMDPRVSKLQIAREAADPSMIYFNDKYYIFASMTLGVWVSDDLVYWQNHKLPEGLPLYDYAPDARVIGDYVYFCASKREEVCHFYRTKNIVDGPYEQIDGSFSFWDPNIFCDEDGRIYFYWGCTNSTPIWGQELDPVTLLPIGEKVGLIHGNVEEKGFERVGENHSIYPASEEEIEKSFQGFLNQQGLKATDLPSHLIDAIKGMFSNKPYIEGAWMDKYEGRYYLQYACPGTQYNTYADGVYISESPLGPFKLAKNNPFSYKPGGFLPGAGHGSTMLDREGNLWHSATMRVSMNHQFERRVGLWPAGYDQDGELYCNQRYGDWPIRIEKGVNDSWKEPDWFLLSYKKESKASSFFENNLPNLAFDENIQTWWTANSNDSGEWIEVDLGQSYNVHCIQVNFADDQISMDAPGEIRGTTQARYIDENMHYTRWMLECSIDGEVYETIEDKSDVETDLSHDLVIIKDGQCARYIRLTVKEIPYDQRPSVSGLRVFGKGDGKKPVKTIFKAVREGDLDMTVHIQKQENVTGYNVLWGHRKDKLYHSCMSFEETLRIGALVKGETYYVRVDAYNENGITQGKIIELG